MRRWEYVDGTSAKFWEAEAEGATVTVRYGRIGTDGRTQVKECASADAAREYLAKAAGEKERKGYEEAGAAATPAAVEAQVLDEDTFVLPMAWRRKLYPRRGGVRRSVPAPTKKALREAADWLAADDPEVEYGLSEPRSEPRLVEAVRAHQAGEADPLGAAVLAVLKETWQSDYALIAHTWATTHGLPFAARATVELFELRLYQERDESGRRRPWIVTLPEYSRFSGSDRRRPAADRIRALLAAADETAYQETVKALSQARDGARRRIIASYLVPTEAEWVDECCTGWDFRDHDGFVCDMLYCSLSSPEQLQKLRGADTYRWSLAEFGTLAEGIGPGFASLMASDLSDVWRERAQRLSGVLLELPTDDAFDILLRSSDNKHVWPDLVKAAQRYPARALRLLAAADRGPALEHLLAAHIAGNPDLARTVLPSLDPEAAAVVQHCLDKFDHAEEAPLDMLPEVLVTPPWTRERAAAEPKVVSGLTAQEKPRIAWAPGEREEWGATWAYYDRWHGTEEQARDASFLRYEIQRGTVRSAGVIVAAPAELIQPLLTDWDPSDDLWDADYALKPVAAKYELAILPALLRAARRQSGIGPLLLPYVSVEVARLMADWAVRLKSAGATARTWFARHGAEVAALLVPDVVGEPGNARLAAEQALRTVATVHGNDTVRAAAASYGPQAAAAVDELLSVDPLENALPAHMPEIPEWAEPMLLPQIRVRTGGALPVASVRHAITMLALSKPGEPYPGVPVLLECCEPASLAEFAWGLFEQWRKSGMPAKESWALHALGLLGDDETVRRLTPLVRAWPGESAHHRAVEGLDVLASIGTDVALLHLHGVAQRVKFKGLKARAQDKITEVAARLGLTSAQLADRLVPDLGLNADGSTVIDYGTRRFTVGFDEQLRPYVLDEDGKRRKDLPQAGAQDDGELAPAERKRFMALKKDVRTIASDQVRRLEAAMVRGRSWTAREFRDLFVQHPLLWHLVRRLVWLSESEDGTATAFRVAEDRTLADVEDDVFELPAGATVSLPHPLHLGNELPAWSELFADYEILQPFPQLGRTVHHLTDEEAAGARLTRFEGITVPTGKLVGLERRGWQRGTPEDNGIERWISKRLGRDRYLVIAPDVGVAVGAINAFPEQTLETVWLDTRPGDYWSSRTDLLRFGDLDPVTVSELLADLTELTAK
ncbi:hypothetical protein GCM10020367_56950 [Streptomyces sannanensis]|uniref:WGR domain-containing protein n=1 Tax=Streptomyces sannanensis TaxID=285536 RepID=A0ABP6SJS4_9ACTN